jgi:Domain of unknown function (DUF4833)
MCASATLQCTVWMGSAVRCVRRGWLVLASGVLALFTSFASAGPPLPVASVQSLFFIAKSENKNQVHYAVVVDAACKPKGDHPVYGYWREREVSPTAVSRLLDHEQRAYGLSEPRYVRQTPTGGQIRIALRGFPERPLIIETFRARGACGARTYVTIRGETALLTSIYVDLGFLFSINYAMLQGVRVADGQRVQEKIHD